MNTLHSDSSIRTGADTGASVLRKQDLVCAVGLDFGSLSCRGIVTDLSDGAILAEAAFFYPHGVMEDRLPDGTAIPSGFVLQHPGDYLAAMEEVLRQLTGSVDPERIAVLGIDTTASTVIPVDRAFQPMCFCEEYSSDPHAWPKMWKHHSIEQAALLTESLKGHGSDIPLHYGGSVGAEFFLPRIMEVCELDPALYDKTETFMELGDWLVTVLAGREVRSGSMLTCKAAWTPEKGYPEEAVFTDADPRLSGLRNKLAFRPGADPCIAWPGQQAGTVCRTAAERFHLCEGTVLTGSQMDSYAGVVGCGVTEEAELHMTLGTSNTFLILTGEDRLVPGICASVRDSIYPGFTTHAAGQSGAGDVFQWFTDNCVPEAYRERAEEAGMNIHAYLTSLAAPLQPGDTGLLCLEWFNGNKSIILDPSLSGMILGLSLSTKPEHIYRALIEATAFGARTIVENYERNGVPVRSVMVSGGISQKNVMLMQIYADILGKEMKVSSCTQAAALGAAAYGAAAYESGRSPAVTDTVKRLCGGVMKVYRPDPENSKKYDSLYREYLTLHDYFGRGGNEIMKRLKKYRKAE